MVGAAELKRFCDESGVVGQGDFEGQLTAWGVDHAEFINFVHQWAQQAGAGGSLEGADPYALLITLVCGFELGYRARIEVELQEGVAG